MRNEQDIKRLREGLTSARINIAQLEARLEMALKEYQHIVDEKVELQNTHQHILREHNSMIGQNLLLDGKVKKLEIRLEELMKLQTVSEAKLIVAAQIEAYFKREVTGLEKRLTDSYQASKNAKSTMPDIPFHLK